MNVAVFALNFLETGGIGYSECCEKVEYTLLSLTSDDQVLLSRARQPFGGCSRVVPSEVIR